MTEYKIPKNTREALERYRDGSCAPGGFLRACLRNDFAAAVALADTENTKALKEIVDWLWRELSDEAWGNSKRVQDWIAKPLGAKP